MYSECVNNVKVSPLILHFNVSIGPVSFQDKAMLESLKAIVLHPPFPHIICVLISLFSDFFTGVLSTFIIRVIQLIPS